MSKTVFVLGADGFIGRHLCSRLSSAGYDILAGVRSFPRVPLPRVTYQVAGFDVPADFTRCSKDCEVFIHAASSSTVASNAANPRVEGNLTTTLALLEALQSHSHGPKLIFLSSAGALYRDDGKPATEIDLPDPRSYHGASKFAAESFIKAWTHIGGGGATVVRPGNVYGPGQYAREGFALIPTSMERLQRGETLTVWGDGSGLRDYLYVDDIVDLLLCAIEMKEWLPWLVLNAGSGDSYTTLEVLSEIERASGKQLSIQHMSRRAVDAINIRIDTSLVRSMLDWKAKTSFSDGIENTWNWISSGRNGT